MANTLRQFSASNVESQPGPLEVIIQGSESRPELTAGYLRPDLLDAARPLVEEYPEIIMGAPAGKALLVERKLRKKTALRLVVLGVLAAIIIGVVLGLSTGAVGIGVATTAGVLSVIAVLVPMLIWMTK